MTATTKIEWTDTTWNPVTGCTKVSPGCDHCYAEGIATRFRGPAFPNGFDVTLRPNRLYEPLKWREPRRVFVNSMSDLFHGYVPFDFIARVFAVMAATPQHTYQILTKRHTRMRSMLMGAKVNGFLDTMADHYLRIDAEKRNAVEWPLPNVWLGVSVETQQWADIRIPALLDTPAAVRFLSCEPLLGLVGIADTLYEGGIHWVIVGGESGAAARPMEPWWARELREECQQAGVPFFFKQWGTFDADGKRVGKAKAGRLLDGRTWDEFPEASA